MIASAYWSVAGTAVPLHCSGAIEVGVPEIGWPLLDIPLVGAVLPGSASWRSGRLGN